MKKSIKSKKGSYTLEAALTLPVFIIVVISLSLIINIISICENICFQTSKELNSISLETCIAERDLLSEGRIFLSVRKNNKKLTRFRIKRFDYLYSDHEINDLISVKTRSSFKVAHPIGISGKIYFDFNLMARGFTGKLEERKPLQENIFKERGQSQSIVIFPKYGRRFHKTNCRYVKQKDKGDERKMTMDKEDAVRKGYTPCIVCGGG